MAKLKGPLFSLSASQQIGKTLVYYNWKGINVVREYVVPVNPDTILQGVQRGYLRTLVAAIHTAQASDAGPLIQADQTAYSALAAAKGKIWTWFNQAVKLGLDALRLADGWTLYGSPGYSNTSKDDLRPDLNIHDDGVTRVQDGKFYLGTSRTNLIQSRTPVGLPGILATLAVGNGFDGLTAGKKYYWQFRPDKDDDCEGSDSGIYYVYAT